MRLAEFWGGSQESCLLACTLYNPFALRVSGTVHLMDFPPTIRLCYMTDLKDFANMVKPQISCFWANQKGVFQSGPDVSRSAFKRVLMKSEIQSSWYTLLFVLKKQTAICGEGHMAGSGFQEIHLPTASELVGDPELNKIADLATTLISAWWDWA